MAMSAKAAILSTACPRECIKGMAMKAAATERGRWFRAVVLALCGAAAMGAVAAGERIVYRLELPGGRVL